MSNSKLKSNASIIMGILLALFARGALAEPRYIPSGSMAPTLQVHDKLVIEKLSPQFTSPERGDIVVFQAKEVESKSDIWSQFKEWQGLSSPPPLIKRVIGLPGETLSVSHGQVWINGKALDEPYIQTPAHYQLPPQTIPQNHVFVLGDNRNNSLDSHVWGVLPIDKIRGQAVFRFWPPSRLGPISTRP